MINNNTKYALCIDTYLVKSISIANEIYLIPLKFLIIFNSLPN